MRSLTIRANTRGEDKEGDAQFEEIAKLYIYSGGEAKNIPTFEKTSPLKVEETGETVSLKGVIMYGLDPATEVKTLLPLAVQEFKRRFPGVLKEPAKLSTRDSIVSLTIEMRSQEDALQYNEAFGDILRQFGLLNEKSEDGPTS